MYLFMDRRRLGKGGKTGIKITDTSVIDREQIKFIMRRREIFNNYGTHSHLEQQCYDNVTFGFGFLNSR